MARSRKLLVVMASLVLVISLASPAAATAPVRDGIGRAASAPSDNLPNPLADQQYADKQAALELVLNGKATPKGANNVVLVPASARSSENGDKIHYNNKNQFVELAQTGEDKIFTVLGEFGAGVATHASHLEDAPGPPVSVTHTGPAGPLHNQIAKPNRKVDNTTIWAPDFSEAYFEDLLFSRATRDNSMANFYLELSSGAYSVSGDVTPWVKVPNNAASYGSDYCGDIVCTDTWLFVNDSVDAWAATSGMNPAQLNAYLAQFDVWDRYDYDGDCAVAGGQCFNEPDGYIDHFQSVHAGQGEEVGGGDQGEDAIWSHRWYAFFNTIGSDGPSFNRAGGVRIGTTNFWIGDYTIEPENGGVGVFSHEFGHDLGLPDLYDTAGGENSTGWWTLMSQGSYGTGNKTDIGSKPIHMGAWEKVQLGWLDYAALRTADATGISVKLGPSMHRTKDGKQGLIVILPEKAKTINIGGPFAGTKFYYSGAGNNLDNFMYKSVLLPAGSPTLTAQVSYATETNFDFAYLVVSTNGGTTWQNVHTTRSDPSFGEGIHGSTGGLWVPLSANLTPWAGQTVLLGFRYRTDGSVVRIGFMADDVTIPGLPLDGAEGTSPAAWTYKPATGGFHATGGMETSFHFNAYIAEFRQYNGYDEGLETSPYNFGFLDNPNLQNWTERFKYQRGLLISYWDTSFEDNNTSEHPGGGLILPIDAHQSPMFRLDNVVWRCRVQSFDSPFGTNKNDKLVIHRLSQKQVFQAQKGVPVFNDGLSYWNAASPLCGVKVPSTGTTIRAGDVKNFYMRVYIN